MPAKWKRCVEEVAAQQGGKKKGKYNAYAVCTHSTGLSSKESKHLGDHMSIHYTLEDCLADVRQKMYGEVKGGPGMGPYSKEPAHHMHARRIGEGARQVGGALSHGAHQVAGAVRNAGTAIGHGGSRAFTGAREAAVNAGNHGWTAAHQGAHAAAGHVGAHPTPYVAGAATLGAAGAALGAYGAYRVGRRLLGRGGKKVGGKRKR